MRVWAQGVGKLMRAGTHALKSRGSFLVMPMPESSMVRVELVLSGMISDGELQVSLIQERVFPTTSRSGHVAVPRWLLPTTIPNPQSNYPPTLVVFRGFFITLNVPNQGNGKIPDQEGIVCRMALVQARAVIFTHRAEVLTISQRGSCNILTPVSSVTA